MLIEDLRKIFENEQLTQILSDNFKRTILNWRDERPEETFGIREDEFNEDGLILNSLNITKSFQTGHDFKIEAECFKIFSNNKKYIYILKLWDDLTIYDDVFYLERTED